VPHGGLSILSDVRGPTLAIVCKQCGRRGRSILKLIARPGWRRWPLPSRWRCAPPKSAATAACSSHEPTSSCRPINLTTL
jgi:hypothetical protein